MNSDGLATLWNILPEARVVGGAVRDRCAGLPIRDIDLACPLAPDAVIDRIETAGLRAIPTGFAHGTVTAMVAGEIFEITTLRHDIATDGRHAVVEFTDDWQADAARRDFTINAMSIDRDGTLFDYFGGRADLAAGLSTVLRLCGFGVRSSVPRRCSVSRAADHDGYAGNDKVTLLSSMQNRDLKLKIRLNSNNYRKFG